MRCVIVIPARMASTRFPGKPLCNLLGKPMIQWVVEAAVRSGVGEQVLIATPDDEIVEACATFGASVVLTSSHHPSGTDRLAEVADHLLADVYVNVQGDEPLIDPETIRACAAPLIADATVQMGSVYSDCDNEELDDPSVVKVVTDSDSFALYFSRFPIPYPRNPRSEPAHKHVGIYAYRREALLAFSTWPVSKLERVESLEQLRFLENRVRIKMSKVVGTQLAVDTPEQADEVRRLLAKGTPTPGSW